MKRSFQRWFLFAFVLVVAICAALGSMIYVNWFLDDNEVSPEEPEVDSDLGYFNSNSTLGIYSKAAVAVDAAQCAPVGRKILERDGHAAEALIAVLLCMGVIIPHSMGLGGGSLLTIYDKNKGPLMIDAREMAPSKANEYMFDGRPDLSSKGVLSIAVPGEIHGYWSVYKKFGGRIPWKDLFESAISLCEDGFVVGEHLANAIHQNENSISENDGLRTIFTMNNGADFYKQGDRLYRNDLAKTLRLLAESIDPVKHFTDEIASKIMEDLKAEAAKHNDSEFILEHMISLEDFRNYQHEERSPVESLLRSNTTLYTFPLPGSGSLLAFILQVMGSYNEFYHDDPACEMKDCGFDPVLFYHRLMETFKFAYSARMSLGDSKFDNVTDVVNMLQDPEFIKAVKSRINDTRTFDDPQYYNATCFMPEDHGTAHVAIIDKFGNAASASATVNAYFGSKILSPTTGILLNDEMDDFSSPNVTSIFDVPPSEQNRIHPGKRPLSSMVPSVFVDNQTGDVRMITGASGGTKITTAVASVSIRHLWLKEDIKSSIDAPRIHHQLFPNKIVYESSFPKGTLELLKVLGHELQDLGSDRGAIVQGITRSSNGTIFANSDYRKGGAVDGF